METKYLDTLFEMGREMHPHLGDDNHTNRLIRKAINDYDNLTKQECFDLGKYYDRMLRINEAIPITSDIPSRLSAVLWLKSLVYGGPKNSQY